MYRVTTIALLSCLISPLISVIAHDCSCLSLQEGNCKPCRELRLSRDLGDTLHGRSCDSPDETTRPLVYFGVADQWKDLLLEVKSWVFVQHEADGFYSNFIMLNSILRGDSGWSPADLAETCRLFVSHRAFLESDVRSPKPGQYGNGAASPTDGASPEQDRDYLTMLSKAGCNTVFTSLNYGWSLERSTNLKSFLPSTQNSQRLNLVQTAAWVLGGDLTGISDISHEAYKKRLRASIIASDGVSTDGPVGLWLTNFNDIRSASISLIDYAHKNGKKAMIMISPFAAGVSTEIYSPRRDFLSQGQQMVRYFDKQQTSPDIWVVFEYSTDIPSVPESIDGKPANTTSGLAYWLIHHVRDPMNWP